MTPSPTAAPSGPRRELANAGDRRVRSLEKPDRRVVETSTVTAPAASSSTSRSPRSISTSESPSTARSRRTTSVRSASSRRSPRTPVQHDLPGAVEADGDRPREAARLEPAPVELERQGPADVPEVEVAPVEVEQQPPLESLEGRRRPVDLEVEVQLPRDADLVVHPRQPPVPEQPAPPRHAAVVGADAHRAAVAPHLDGGAVHRLARVVVVDARRRLDAGDDLGRRAVPRRQDARSPGRSRARAGCRPGTPWSGSNVRSWASTATADTTPSPTARSTRQACGMVSSQLFRPAIVAAEPRAGERGTRRFGLARRPPWPLPRPRPEPARCRRSRIPRLAAETPTSGRLYEAEHVYDSAPRPVPGPPPRPVEPRPVPGPSLSIAPAAPLARRLAAAGRDPAARRGAGRGRRGAVPAPRTGRSASPPPRPRSRANAATSCGSGW